jgi:hypothetical protein
MSGYQRPDALPPRVCTRGGALPVGTDFREAQLGYFASGAFAAIWDFSIW